MEEHSISAVTRERIPTDFPAMMTADPSCTQSERRRTRPELCALTRSDLTIGGESKHHRQIGSSNKSSARTINCMSTLSFLHDPTEGGLGTVDRSFPTNCSIRNNNSTSVFDLQCLDDVTAKMKVKIMNPTILQKQICMRLDTFS